MVKENQRYMWEIYVPKGDNSGGEFTKDHHQQWDSKVRKFSGGLTIFSTVKGQWENEDKVYTEEMIPVRIICTKSQMLEILGMTKRHYHQKTVVACLVSEYVIIMGDSVATSRLEK